MLATKIEDAKREEGFTLIELLVVVIIIGILAAIAIPTFLGQREKAWQRAAESDLRNNSVQVETFFSDNGTYAGAFTAPLGTPARVSDNVTVTLVNPTSTAYCLQAIHGLLDTPDTFNLNSATGRVATGPCT
jgi:type IV pilus assembly protein PilA